MVKSLALVAIAAIGFTFSLTTCLFTFAVASNSPSVKSGNVRKLVTVNLESNWPQTPVILEVAEFVAEENKQLFWTFIDTLYEKLPPGSITSMSPGDQYDLALTIASDVLGPASHLSLLKFALSLRFYSPIVAMFQQISTDIRPGDICSNANAFVQYSTSTGSQLICSLSDLKQVINDPSNLKIHTEPIEMLKDDHVYGNLEQLPTETAILYGQIGTKSFHAFHSYLKESAKIGKHGYLVRHFVSNPSNEPVSLSGYGVELAIKSTEYRAVDDTRVKGEESSFTKELKEIETEDVKEVAGFVIPTLKSLHPNKTKNIEELTSYLQESTKEIATLKVWELQELSLQVVNHILTQPKSDALQVFKDLVENFPAHAKKLIHTNVPKDLRREIETNQHMVLNNLNLGTSDTALFIDGMFFDLDTVDVFGLYGYLKNEVKMAAGLHSILGSSISPDKFNKLTRLEISSSKADHFTIDFRDSAVVFVNDIEQDKQYRSWPSSINDLLRPTYPGMLRNVRKNMYNLVIIADASKQESFDLIKLAESFYVHRAPLRIGFVFITSQGSGLDVANVALLNAFNYISLEKSHYEGLSFITDVIAAVSDRDIKSGDVINLFKSKFKDADLNTVFGPDSDFDTGRRLTQDFLERTGLGYNMRVLLNGVIINENHLNADLFEDAVLSEIMRQTPWIQKAVYNKELSDAHDVTDWLMSQKNVLPRLNKHIMNTKGGQFIDLSGDVTSPTDDLNSLPTSELLSYFHKKVKFLTRHSNHCHAVSVLLSCDLGSSHCRQLVLSALNHLIENSESMRIALIHQNENSYSQLIEAAIHTIKDQKVLLPSLVKILKLNHLNDAGDGVSSVSEKYQQEIKHILDDESTSHKRTFELHRLVHKKIFADAGSEFVVVNGRLIRIPSDSTFTVDDFNLIERYDRMSYGEKLRDHLASDTKGSECSNLVMKVASVLLAQTNSKTRHDLDFLHEKKSVLKLEPMDKNSPAIDVLAIVEPLSRGAQRLLPILTTLQRVVNMKVRVFFNCIERHSELPLKTFSRFVLEPELAFGADGSLLKRSAVFASMPLKPLFTLAMVTPENWLVEAIRSPHDLDNIHLEEVDGKGVWADFKLESLLLEGHCFEQSTGNPPRGLQIVLASSSDNGKYKDVVGDTIVMANLGYFQLKAKPGAWKLALREGRSSDIYQIMSYEGPDATYNTNGNVSTLSVVISSFKSHLVKLKVNKKPGQTHKDLLSDIDDPEGESHSIWDSLGSWSSSKPSPSPASSENERVDIFSLASGHLYERLLRIMMLSVLKNTKSPVKFWFLKNYLSPTFKDILPSMAKEYGFEYELVEYKWPRWLNQQTEKQRVIWGYKILFLDVLFPLSLKRVIYIDADQVVRADVKELKDMDLENAPYAYTPFCDSREDMDGFRFWKSGYWANHLHGRKYHISALYVVDLQRFRRVAAGDRLRGQYQGLSQDPNSLSNLDQDLPNNMIHQVAIKSLPQEWLWCETWCDDRSKAKAKTIDLCNNPKTKEPKLTAARRIIPEWESYDNEIKALMNKLHKKHQHQQQQQQHASSESKKENIETHDAHTEL